jgi:hypothetical protein
MGAQAPGLGERAFKKIILQRDLADLRMERLHVNRRLDGTPLCEDHGGTAQQLFAPLADLVRMHIEALRQLGEAWPRLSRPQNATFALNAGE